MSLTVDWPNRVVISDASITDLPAFKDALRLLEEGAQGVLYPAILTYKRVDLGGGAFFHAVDFINGYALRFLGAGPFSVVGNLNCPIQNTGVQVERKTSAAFSTTSGAGGLTTDQAASLARIEKLLRNKQVTDPSTGTMTVFDDDGSTVLLQGPLYENAAGTVAYRGQGAERRERLQ
jgi:hypothetical protein